MAKERVLPGIVSEENREVHDASQDLLEARDDLNDQRKKVNSLTESLARIMRKNKVERYRRGGVFAHFTKSEKLHVERYREKGAKA